MDLQEVLQLDDLLQAIEEAVQQELPEVSVRQLFGDLMQGSQELDIVSLAAQIAELLCSDIVLHCSFIGQMILLGITAAVLRQIETSFSGDTIQKVTGLMVKSIAVLLLLKSGSGVLLYGQETVLRLAELMQLLLPVQLLLMTCLGNIQTAGLLQPSLLLIVQIAVWFFRTVLLPLVTIEFALKLINSFSDTYKLQGIASFLRKLILSVVAFSTMLFLAILSIQGISGHVLDRLSLRTVKYIAGTAIPIVGGTLSGLFETLLSGALMIRSAVGFIGLLAVLVLTIVPALKILLLYFLYSFTAAILQPIGDGCINDLLEQSAGTYMLLFAVVALTGVFFFFMILIVLAAGGAVLG